jgi:predicted LPLAT superfamily acyltransferase
MAKTKRVQVLMDPNEFDALGRVARSHGTSVASLMREAVSVRYACTADRERRAMAAQQFLQLPDTRLPAWRALKKEIEDRRGPRLP